LRNEQQAQQVKQSREHRGTVTAWTRALAHSAGEEDPEDADEQAEENHSCRLHEWKVVSEEKQRLMHELWSVGGGEGEFEGEGREDEGGCCTAGEDYGF